MSRRRKPTADTRKALYHALMPYYPDDISQYPDHRSDRPADQDFKAQVTTLLHKRLDQVIDQEHQPGLTPAQRQHLADLHRQIRQDLDTIRYQTKESTLRAVWREIELREM